MIKFIGEYTAKIDDKGRLVLPSAFKAIMAAESRASGNAEDSADMRMVIKKDIYEDCLEMYTYEEWVRQSEELKSRLNFLKREHAMFWRAYMRDRALVEPDGKLGRISIPKKLLESIGADKEVVFSGNDHKIEIWAKDRFESNEVTDEEFVALAGMLSD
ncbi:MAG: hypothetical protein NC308_08350 [Clostridium sp.]|nr:hypothetical protein [Bacteroides sp.]MCM1198887.1 hypothetical protein [Clostridium sp.]